MLTQDQVQTFQAPFPPEALTSIKAAQAPAVIKRLNEVFGPCSIDWRCVHSPFEELHTDNKQVEIVTEVAFQYRFNATNDCTGCGQVEQRPGWHHRPWLHPDVRINDARGRERLGWIKVHVVSADRLPPGVNPARLQAAPQFPPGSPLCHRDQMD